MLNISLEREFVHSKELIQKAHEEFPNKIALVSSFGADAAVLLHLALSVKQLPIIFLDSLRHFPQTMEYVHTLKEKLKIADLRIIKPDIVELATEDPQNQRASYDPDGCCDLRKTRPLARALSGFSCWISGRKRFQSASRSSIPEKEADGQLVKINPLADWVAADVQNYMTEFELPAHPLGPSYPSIGCEPCTSAVAPGEDPRSGRWRGTGKTECGIHQAGK